MKGVDSMISFSAHLSFVYRRDTCLFDTLYIFYLYPMMPLYPITTFNYYVNYK